MKVLHITPHLGGGLGKALSTVSEALPKGAVHQVFALLEEPIDHRHISRIRANGYPVVVAKSLDYVAQLAREVDIVQFEYSNHPRMLECLARTDFPVMRSVFWSHISGLYQPFIHPGLIKQAQRFVFTSKISCHTPTMQYLDSTDRKKVSVINSGFGFQGDNYFSTLKRAKPTIGYLGTVNFVKMHPGFFNAIDRLKEDVDVLLWGATDQHIVDDVAMMDHPERFKFYGETPAPAAALSKVDIFFYPLQPKHFGTGENSLVEAMSLGLPPIVMNNPAEMEIITDGVTGFIAHSVDECTELLESLIRSPTLRRAISRKAIQYVNATRSPAHAAMDFMILWHDMFDEAASRCDFPSVIGNTPAEWFLSTQQLPGMIGHELQHHGEIKGSRAHFEKVFAGDLSLAQLG